MHPADQKEGLSIASEACLLGWPRVVDDLRSRGVHLARGPEESADEFENRIGTSLMTLWRDDRRSECFEALYEFSRSSVLQWIRSLLHRGQAALDPLDLLQDTFVNVYRYPTAFREEHAGSFRVWVRTIAGNLIRRATTSRQRISFLQLSEAMAETEERAENPFHRALQEEQEQRIHGAWALFLSHYWNAWRGLGLRDRRTLQLIEVEGLSYEEAGRILGVGRSNMKMIVFRSRKRIARRMRQTMSACLLRPRLENVA
jgi:RNA polymerase sigma factor (sigma-70 family)